MLILIVGIAQAAAFVLHLAPSTPSQRKKRRITTNPLLTTRRFDQRRCGIATETTMLASHRFGFHAVVCHDPSLVAGMGRHVSSSLARCTVLRTALASLILSISTRPSWPVAMGPCERTCTMSQFSKVNHSRHQWKGKAQQRGDTNRSLRKELARVKAERDQATQALKETQARLRQLESHVEAVAVRPKVDLVWLALRLFLEVRISCRAICRVLSLLAPELGITKAPCPQTVLNGVMRLSIVRIESAHGLRGLPLSQAPFSNGLIWMIELSIGLGSGKI